MITHDPVYISLPAVIKAGMDNGKRMVEIQASAEVVDLEGDLVRQCALLSAAPGFVKSGVLDYQHLSEIGSRMDPPIPNPLAYIVGNPREVKDIGGGCTSVIGELHKARSDGKITKADEIWETLKADPPMPWRASIFGYPTMNGYLDVRAMKSGDTRETFGATRYLVTEIVWKSLAFTMNPICDGIENTARIITEKALIKSMLGKSYSLPVASSNSSTPTSEALAGFMFPPRSREELMGQYYAHIKKGQCPFAGGEMGNSVFSFREHFANCCCEDPWTADLHGIALLHLLKRESRS